MPRSESYGSVESVKAASDVYLPVGGEIVEVNTVRTLCPPASLCLSVC